MESTNDEQITAFNCAPGSLQYSIIEAVFKNPPPVLFKSQDGKFWMTNIFLDINEIYIIKNLTYNIAIKVTKMTRKDLKLRKKLLFLSF